MKILRALATVVAVGVVAGAISAGPVAAMPITLAFEGTIIAPEPSSDDTVYVSGGGIFAPGQSVKGTVRYDPGSVLGSQDNNGGKLYSGGLVGISFSVDAAGGVYEGQSSLGLTFACQGPLAGCSPAGGKDAYVLLGIIPDNILGQPVNGMDLAFLILAFVGEDILTSNALLSSAELVSLFDRAPEIYFDATFTNDNLICDEETRTCVNQSSNIRVSLDKLSVVSEPGTIGLMLVGVTLMARRRRALKIALPNS